MFTGGTTGSVGIVLALEAFFLSIGWVYLTDKLFQDFSYAASRTKISTRILFSWTLASSLTIFALLVFEVANVLDQGYICSCDSIMDPLH
jgi:hypothetical protein